MHADPFLLTPMIYDFCLLLAAQRSVLDVIAQTGLTILLLGILELVRRWLAKNGKNIGITMFNPIGEDAVGKEPEPRTLPLHQQSVQYLVGRMIGKTTRFWKQNPEIAFVIAGVSVLFIIGVVALVLFNKSP